MYCVLPGIVLCNNSLLRHYTRRNMRLGPSPVHISHVSTSDGVSLPFSVEGRQRGRAGSEYLQINSLVNVWKAYVLRLNSTVCVYICRGTVICRSASHISQVQVSICNLCRAWRLRSCAYAPNLLGSKYICVATFTGNCRSPSAYLIVIKEQLL